MAILLTGGSGFLGRQLAAGLVAAGEQVTLLVRARGALAAAEKVRAALGETAARVAVVRGDLSLPGLGLAAADRERILATCDSILHCAADVRFDLPLERARAINVAGTAALLDLAAERQRRGGLARFDYVSTAYVAGTRTGLVLESELDGRHGHRNTYELTKFEAENLVRRARDEMPIAIFRPSIVVGDSGSGRTTSFHMIYWPTRAYAAGIWRICPGHAATPLDLAPVNFVRDALLAIRGRRDSLGRCFHLAAGPARSITLGEIAGVVQGMFPRRKPVRFVAPGPWMRYMHPPLKTLTWGRTRRVLRLGEQFVPYFTQNPEFDNAGTAEFLAGTGVAIPDARDYVERLFRYCAESDWGAAAN